MKIIKTVALTLGLSTLALANAQTGLRYEIKLTNGSNMPISPIVAYTTDGQLASTRIGQVATPGLVALCQTGNGTTRLEELTNDSAVHAIAQTSGLLMPGETKTVELAVENPNTQSIHFEAMYGKTKDTCAVGSMGGHDLYALKLHVINKVVKLDRALQTGAFLSPSITEAGKNYKCLDADNAVSCLRELASANEAGKIQFFTPYLPSVLTFLEQKYGAADVQTLQLSAAGAVEFEVSLKH